MSGRRRETLPDVQEWWVVPPGSLGVVGGPSQMSEIGRVASKASRMFGSVREWSGGPLGCPSVSRICREAFSDVRECLGVVGRPSRMSGSGWESLHGCPSVVGSPARIYESGREDLPDVRKWSGGPPGCPGVSGSGW